VPIFCLKGQILGLGLGLCSLGGRLHNMSALGLHIFLVLAVYTASVDFAFHSLLKDTHYLLLVMIHIRVSVLKGISPSSQHFFVFVVIFYHLAFICVFVSQHGYEILAK